MRELFGSWNFGIGLILLIAHQYSRFRELVMVENLPEETHRLLNLTARDFIGPWTFAMALLSYLLATAAIYLFICAVLPEVEGNLSESFGITFPWNEEQEDAGVEEIAGVIAGSEAAAADSAAGHAESTSRIPKGYVIWVAAIYMGLAMPSVPIGAYISNGQRKFFHDLIGIPRRVIQTSKDFSIDLGLQLDGEEQIRAKIQWLAGLKWRDKINEYADMDFYDRKLRELRLKDDDVEKAIGGSEWHLRNLLDALIFTSVLAVTRRSGGGGLVRLSRDLDLPRPKYQSRALVAVACFVLFAVTTTLLVFAVVLLGALAGPSLIPSPDAETGRSGFWPTDVKSAISPVQDLVVPMLLSVGLAFGMLTPKVLGNLDDTPSDPVPLLVRATPLVLMVLFGVVVFDFLLMVLRTAGSRNGDLSWLSMPATFENRELLWSSFWYFMLHAAVVALACILVVAYGRRLTDDGPKPSLRRWIWRMSLWVGGASAAFAIVKLLYQIKVELRWIERLKVWGERPDGTFHECWLRQDEVTCQTLMQSLDFIALVVMLNVAAAVVGLLAAYVVYKKTESARPARLDPRPAPA